MKRRPKLAAARPAAVVILEFYEGRGWEALDVGVGGSVSFLNFSKANATYTSFSTRQRSRETFPQLLKIMASQFGRAFFVLLLDWSRKNSAWLSAQAVILTVLNGNVGLLPPRPCGELRKISPIRADQ
jgi:hypothetical protein